jgi:hypothetical protein
MPVPKGSGASVQREYHGLQLLLSTTNFGMQRD